MSLILYSLDGGWRGGCVGTGVATAIGWHPLYFSLHLVRCYFFCNIDVNHRGAGRENAFRNKNAIKIMEDCFRFKRFDVVALIVLSIPSIFSFKAMQLHLFLYRS